MTEKKDTEVEKPLSYEDVLSKKQPCCGGACSCHSTKSVLDDAIGRSILITTDDWFAAPDGQLYKAVFGKLVGVFNDKETLGIETNGKSTNWYAVIGGMIVGGCQIHYAILTDTCDCEAPYLREELIGDEIKEFPVRSRIWHAK